MKRLLAVSILFVLLPFSTTFFPKTSAFALFAQEAKNNDSYKRTLDRLESLSHAPQPEWRIHSDIQHPELPSLNDSAWQVLKVKDHWKGSRVFRRRIVVPEKVHGYDVRGYRMTLDLSFHSEDTILISLFVNGSLISRGDEDTTLPVLLSDSAQPGQQFLIAARVDAGDEDAWLDDAQLRFEAPANRPDPDALRMEILSSLPIIAAYADGRSEREHILDEAVKAIDFDSLEKGDQKGFNASLRLAQSKLEALRPWMRQFTIRAVGNSHIDMAWLWPWTETVEVVRNTFRSVLDLMREYPDFKFTMSSARTYEWMEEKYPDMFHEIQQRVKEGRWEIVGGMWVEPDLNMPAGESLVRQILVGKEYFQQKFGVDPKIGWNPDSFGYNWQLPQIYKKSGMDYFVTQKLIWAHEFTTFPYKLFWWQSPDGTRILTYFPHDYAGGIDGDKMAEDLSVWAPAIYGSNTKDNPTMMHLYGVGDHGGGPTRSMLDHVSQLTAPSEVYPKFEFSTAGDFFKDLEPKLPSLQVPTWNDELYFQYHRGVLTTQAETKRRIRRSEENILNAEQVSSLAYLLGRPYPQDELLRDWKRLLFDHFHDIMPGSGIAVNYLDAKRNLEDVQLSGTGITNAALSEIVAHIDTQGDGVPVVVFNTLSWPRTDVTEISAQLAQPSRAVQVFDAVGNRVPSEVVDNDPATGRIRMLVLTHLPAIGYKVYFVRAASNADANAASGSGPNAGAMPELKASSDSLENEFVRLKIDPKTGCMTSFFDKHSQTEALAPSETDTGGPQDRVCGNLLQTFVDKPKKWDAWNIDADFEKTMWNLDKADDVKLIESGPLRAVIRVKNHFQNSTFVRDITMYAGVPRVDVKMSADWHEKHILLKVAFPLSAHNDKATFEIPYGSIQRPTTRNIPAEKAEFEVPAQRWADISDATHGLSLLNDCKYGYDAKGNVLRLSLLRSPEWPDPHADEGHHEFTYSLFAHGGSWIDAQTIRRGYELNYQLISMSASKHQGQFAAEHSFVGIEPDNLVLTAVKAAEDGDGLILRFYEWAGKEVDAKLTLPAGAQSAEETDLMEHRLAESGVAGSATGVSTIGALLQNNVVTVHTKPYEIKTVKVKFALPKSEALTSSGR
ncbi:MAG: alpha-mannosidase [Terriglobales bacterium]|jgi:alpha-mannosidase